MTIAPLVKEPAPILHRKATRVESITDEIRTLIDTMVETMHAVQGVGLAANQIGSHWNIFVASEDSVKGKELVLINPVLLKRRGQIRSEEGCLSLPGISGEVTRWAEVTAQGLNRQGTPVTIQAKALLARILQHEIDHLQGHLYPDRLPLLERRRLLQTYQKLRRTLGQVDL